MVKLKGPGLSGRASGTVADVLTFAELRTRSYAKKHARPKNPKTQPQLANRIAVGFLAQEWKKLTPADQATWIPVAEAAGIYAYHAYIGNNAKRWHNFRGPSKRYPAAELTIPSAPRPMLATGVVGRVEITVLRLAAPLPWGWCIFRSPNGVYVPSLDTLLQIIPDSGGLFTTTIDYGVPAGTWRYMAFLIYDDGVFELNASYAEIILT